MQQIVNFVIRNKTFLLFLLLFCVSLGLTIQSHSYHKSKFINSANFLSGGIYNTTSNIRAYFSLKKQNEVLIDENKRLKSILFNSDQHEVDNSALDSTIDFNFKFNSANVIKNSYAASKNYLTIDKGQNDSIVQDLGVITSKGIVGIIDKASSNYARILSILNTKSRINAQLKSTDHIGSLTWNAKSPEFVQLIDISKFAPVRKGDTIITGGQSSIFPKGILIGLIDSYTLDASGDTYTVNVKLFNDMTNIGHVYIIKNKDFNEIRSLQNQRDE
ncbi:rod shape-determining protein MreC [Geojedonia litorea]|uniref:Cell shape-determining protein MreC n=1 Tax=Geojedonia litorea TaxID=1268269 RepID=A0ABV9N7F8_9FLAO